MPRFVNILNQKTLLSVNESVEGESIEDKIERITTEREPITDSSPIIYTERKDGVQPEYNPRTDTWEIAIDAMGTLQKQEVKKRWDAIAERDGKAKPADTTTE